MDTILVNESQFIYQLTGKPVVRSSAQVVSGGKLIMNAIIHEIAGELELRQPLADSAVVYVSYKYLLNSIPIQIGPYWKEFPLLDSIAGNGELGKPVPNFKAIDNDPYQTVSSTGTVYRHLQVSPLGGTNFGGGMQISLQGNLSREIHVSGVLTDQQTGIMPEGNTRELDEFDQIYLNVDHPNFSITAGDIDYLQSLDNSMEVSRKLTGLKQSFNYGDFSGSAVFGGSNGSFHEVNFDGQDGNQGPYQLRSSSGNSDIIVLSGTEKVYLDGELLTRGENHDYTIDYSLGELHFNPKNQIEFDSHIHVEYQYSDFQYSRNLTGGLVSKELLENSMISIAWYREYDQVIEESSLFSTDILDSLGNAGDKGVVLTTAEEDSAGNYILIDNRFVYKPDATLETRYSVTFQNDPEDGEYIRKVTERGQLYYEFLSSDQRSGLTELYSPERSVKAPVSKDLIFLRGDFSFNPGFNIDVAFKTSNYDKNTLSTINDNDNLGIDYSARLHGIGNPLSRSLEFSYDLEYWNRNDTFMPLGRSRSIDFNQDWGLSGSQKFNESKFQSILSVKNGDMINLTSGYTLYQFGKDNLKRINSEFSFSRGFIHEMVFNQNYVTGTRREYSTKYWKIGLLRGRLHPFIEGESEYSGNSHSFQIIKSGVSGELKYLTTSLSVGSRDDEVYSNSSGSMVNSGESWFGALDMKMSTRTFRQELELRKRIKNLPLENSSLDYELMRLKISRNDPMRPFSFDWSSRLEENLTETRAVVFDSVGKGYGQYRYDPVFNEYVEDPNGPYRSYTIFSGDKRPATNFSNSGRIRFDLSKLNQNKLEGLSIDNTFQSEYRGNEFVPGKILEYTIDDEFLKADFKISTDFIYRKPTSARRISVGIDYFRNLNGLDPRGNSQSERNEYNYDINEPLNSRIVFVSSGDIHRGQRKSLVLVSRGRDYRGWGGEAGLKYTNAGVWRLSGFLQGGGDTGNSAGENFRVKYYGTRIEVLRFTGKKGRLEFIGDWNYGSGNVKYYDLPPEVLNNLTLGENMRIQVRGQYLIGEYFALNTNLTFIDNARYERFVSVTGELRAYF